MASERCKCNDFENHDACGDNCVCLPHSLRSRSIMGRDACKVCGATVPVESRKMPTDPKTPEEILALANTDAHYQTNVMRAHYATTEPLDVAAVRVHKSIDHLAAVARLVGRIQQHTLECRECAGPTNTCQERDRLLAELAGMEKR